MYGTPSAASAWISAFMIRATSSANSRREPYTLSVIPGFQPRATTYEVAGMVILNTRPCACCFMKGTSCSVSRCRSRKRSPITRPACWGISASAARMVPSPLALTGSGSFHSKRIGGSAGQILHAAVRRHHQLLGGDVLQRRANPALDHRLSLDVGCAQVQHANDHRLGSHALEDGEVQVWLGGLDRDLIDGCLQQVLQERITDSYGFVLDDQTVPETGVQNSRRSDAVECAIDGF